MNTQQIARTVREHWTTHVIDSLQKYVKIPNVSPIFDPDWKKKGHMNRAADLLANAVSEFCIEGLSLRIEEIPNHSPLLFLEFPPQNGGVGNALLYGHFDKQPEFSGWHPGKGPWNPIIENGRLYGRGTGDDGYAIFSCLAAIKALQEQQHPIPRCTIIIEGSEESGSPDLPDYLTLVGDEIGTPDLVVCLDAEAGNYDQLWLTTSLRGMVTGTLTVSVLNEGVHSGGAGGIVPSSFRILRALFDRIEDSKTGELHQFLHTDIPEWAIVQSTEVAETLGDTVVNRYPWVHNVQKDPKELASVLLLNSWYPSMETVGLGGAPQPEKAGNTLRPYTSAKMVFRLPPNADARNCAEFIRTELERSFSSTVRVAFELEGYESGWYSKPVESWLHEALEESSTYFFENSYQKMGTGGTIPFARMLGDQFPDCQFLCTGVLGPHSNAHGPNEFLDLKTAERVTCCVAYVLGKLASAT